MFLQEPLKGFKRLKSDRSAHVEIYFARVGGLWSTFNDEEPTGRSCSIVVKLSGPLSNPSPVITQIKKFSRGALFKLCYVRRIYEEMMNVRHQNNRAEHTFGTEHILPKRDSPPFEIAVYVG